jgi:hypothetical protein
MRHRGRVARVLLPATFVLVPAALAATAVSIGRVQHVTVHFGAQRPAASSMLRIDVRGLIPPAGAVLPPAIRQTVTLPAGARVDTSAAKTMCTASVVDLIAKGAEGACPAGSLIGSGLARGIVRGAAVHYELAIYAFPGKLDFAAERLGKPLKAGFFGVISGRAITFDVTTAGGTIAPTEFLALLPQTSHHARALVRTPSQCPRSGTWTSRVRVQALTAASGGQPTGPAQTLETTTPCRRR